MLYSRGKRVIFVSNNSTRPRAILAKTIRDLGITSCRLEHAYNTSWAAASYLKDTVKMSPSKRVLVLGEYGIVDEMKLVGFDAVLAPSLTIPQLGKLELSKEFGAVVVGMCRDATYTSIGFASVHAAQKDIHFIATNTDPVFPTERLLFPGAGSLVAAVSTAAQRKPVVLGKPQPHMCKLVFDALGLPDEERARSIVIGDSIHTDIPVRFIATWLLTLQFAKMCKCGMRSLLVLTGVTSPSDVALLRSKLSSARPVSQSYDLDDPATLAQLSVVGGIPELQTPDFVAPSLELFAKL